MGYFKAVFLAIALLFLAGTVSAYYPYGGSYGALEYPNSYYNMTYSRSSVGPYGSYYNYYNTTPYSNYYYSNSTSYYPSYNYGYPAYSYYPSTYYYAPSYGKEFYWNGFGFNFLYRRA